MWICSELPGEMWDTTGTSKTGTNMHIIRCHWILNNLFTSQTHSLQSWVWRSEFPFFCSCASISSSHFPLYFFGTLRITRGKMPSCSFLSERGRRRRSSALGLWWVNPSITQKHFYGDKSVHVHFRLSLFSAIIVAFQTHKATQWNTIVHGWSIKLSLRGSLLLSDYRAWIPSLWEVWRPTPTEQSPARPCPAQPSSARPGAA